MQTSTTATSQATELAYQTGIFQPIPPLARYAFFSIANNADAAAIKAALKRLQTEVDGKAVVAALGPQLVAAVGAQVPGLREFPQLTCTNGLLIPSTPAALMLWLRGTDMGDLANHVRAFEKLLAPAFGVNVVVDAFRHGDPEAEHGRDLTGYEDGTENPEGEEAEAAAFVQDAAPGLQGSSFVAVQQWVHDYDQFESFSTEERDHIMGRRLTDNEELEDAPESAHVKRTAQESFEPEAFVLRRSMPWLLHDHGEDVSGLMFAAYGKSLDAYEAQMRRMAGLDDGITDGLLRFSHPTSGSYLWCPPMHGGQLDLRLLKI
ncbi:Dyp-type peroxidase [Diaphorobacter sp. HDW4B]|uniref:Dyp-type peroxidase n=1 Tax=Diaphorobacter sp. HDW4B TaxID=2714925 RepID=UPI00140A1924|nr:Dyp-type peroxidase [Diaphorobacter sp. HDW4B]QIL72596.1 Dyp-type peroxidase [Diaphorobacter sp. HDW4B]